MKKGLLIALVVLVLGCLGMFAVAQIIPFGRAHQNPPVVAEPAWDSPQTRALAQRACFDCHSNETVWPWYSNVAPVSWLLQRDVNEGREKLNFSEWGMVEQEADEIYEAVQEGEMPMGIYLLTHPEARLSSEEKSLLLSGFEKMFGRGDD